MNRTLAYGILVFSVACLLLGALFLASTLLRETPSNQLILREGTNQLVVSNTYGNERVYLFESRSSIDYNNTWTSDAYCSNSVDIGDVDNDGSKEIVSVRTDREIRMKMRLNLWENSSSSSPTVRSLFDNIFKPHCARDIEIGDADNDGKNEVVLAGGNYIAVFEYNVSTTGFDLLWKSLDCGALIWSASIGDADNDGKNEIVGARFEGGYALVWEFKEGTWVNAGMTDSLGTCNIDRAEIGDVDNDGLNEIVGGGTRRCINVWKFDGTSYKIVWIGGDLGGFTQGVGIGDVDGDGKNEIVAGASYGSSGKVHVIKYDGTMYHTVWSYNLDSFINMVSVGDSDNDGIEEFAVLGRYLSVFDHETSGYTLAWTTDKVSGSSLAIG